jgi:hypothetical protein
LPVLWPPPFPDRGGGGQRPAGDVLKIERWVRKKVMIIWVMVLLSGMVVGFVLEKSVMLVDSFRGNDKSAMFTGFR